jgi:hypothetical protein
MLLTSTSVTREQFFFAYCGLVVVLMLLAAAVLPSHKEEVRMWSSKSSDDSSGSSTTPLLTEDQATDQEDTGQQAHRSGDDGALDGKTNDAVGSKSSESSSGGGGGGGGGGSSGGGGGSTGGNSGNKPTNSPTLLQELYSPVFMSTALFYALILFVGTYVNGALPDILAKKAARAHASTPKKDLFVNVLLPVLSSIPALIFNPLASLVIGKGNFALCFFLCNLISQLVCAVAMLPSLDAQIGTMLLGVARNALLFSGLFTFLDQHFAKEHYGSLVAVCTGVAAVVGAAVVPLVEFSHKRYDHVLLILMAGSMACYAQPLLLLRSRQQPSAQQHDK